MTTARLSNRLLAIVLAVFTTITLSASVASARNIDSKQLPADFTAQASRTGLSTDQAKTLQAAVDKEIAAHGGTQTSPNEILWKDGSGSTVLPVPNQQRTTSLGQNSAAAAAGPGCRYYYICLYSGSNFTGTMYELYFCRDYPTSFNWQSYDNNQTENTVAEFKYQDGTHQGWSEPAHTFANYDGSPVYLVKPC